tara:strand:- start:1209 stop:1757 length:549 start_codon:yes stop_codon:yes gene_type:complete
MKNIKEFIMVKNNIPKDVCKNIIKKLNNEKWYKHAWYNYTNNKTNNLGNKEFDTSWSDKSQNILQPYIIKTIQDYEKFTNQKNFLCSRFSKIRFNKYTKNTNIQEHVDHIHSLFDGNEKGIPVLSIVGLLNENFKGGNFYINNVLIKIKTGDVLVFPSCFLYPHQVKNITQGKRYSFVTWCY